jgi:hypothetical protein
LLSALARLRFLGKDINIRLKKSCKKHSVLMRPLPALARRTSDIL